jgi:hypothetical protein
LLCTASTNPAFPNQYDSSSILLVSTPADSISLSISCAGRRRSPPLASGSRRWNFIPCFASSLFRQFPGQHAQKFRTGSFYLAPTWPNLSDSSAYMQEIPGSNPQHHGRPPRFVFHLSCSLPFSWLQMALASKSTHSGTAVAIPSVQVEINFQMLQNNIRFICLLSLQTHAIFVHIQCALYQHTKSTTVGSHPRSVLR